MSKLEPDAIEREGAEALVERMAAHHSRFLGFIRARVDSTSTAEDILQSAYIKAIEHGQELREGESSVAWFYRVLRNAITDKHRRQAVSTRALEQFARESPQTVEPELEETVCACIGDVIQDLKDEYRDAIEKVDLGGMSVQAFAEATGSTANNAYVRLHRARKAVAKNLTSICGTCAEHKCVDCTCKPRV